MSYNISSEKFQHPLLKQIFEKLTEYFFGMNIQFYVIGATARDIIMMLHNEKSGRATHDLDIAIAISNWDEYTVVEKGILKTFLQFARKQHRHKLIQNSEQLKVSA